MADFDVGDVVRLGAVMKFDALYDIVNVFHVQLISGPGWTFAAAAGGFAAYLDVLYAGLTTYYSSLITDDRIQVKNMTQDTIWGSIAWGSWAGGTSVADPTPLQVALLGFGRTPISRVQIRKYMGPFTEVDLTGGIWGAGIRAAIQTFMDYLITPHTLPGTMEMHGCAYRHDPVRVTFAQTAATSAAPVIQRRRRVGRGS